MKGFNRRLLVIIVIISLFFSNGVAFAEEKLSQKQDLRTASSEVPNYQEIYEKMIALEEKYPEGMRWDEEEPYSLKNGYFFEALGYMGAECAGFAYAYSDDVFGKDAEARIIGKKKFTYEIIQVGDILKIINDSGTSNHYVVVLEVASDGVTVVEGNYGGTVHWGRFMSKEHVEKNFVKMITRYPDTSYHYAAREENKRLYDSDNKEVDRYSLKSKKKVLIYRNIKVKKVEQAGFDIDGDLIYRKTNGTVDVIDHETLEVKTIYRDIDKLGKKKANGLTVSVKYGKMSEKIKK